MHTDTNTITKKKILVVGDVHGSNKWKSIKPKLYDKIIFIGDYLDSFDYNGEECLENLKEIIKFKKENDNVILLLGNHELHYILKQVQYSGYQPTHQLTYRQLLEENITLFTCLYQYNNYIFSHAGLSKSYYTYIEEEIKNYSNKFTMTDLEVLSNLHIIQPSLLDIKPRNCGGYSNFGSILWERYNIIDDFYTLPNQNTIHVVGHTYHDNYIITPNVIFVDSIKDNNFLLFQI